MVAFIFIYILDLWLEELRVTFLDTNLLNEKISGFPCEWERDGAVLHSMISTNFLLFL